MKRTSLQRKNQNVYCILECIKSSSFLVPSLKIFLWSTKLSAIFFGASAMWWAVDEIKTMKGKHFFFRSSSLSSLWSTKPWKFTQHYKNTVNIYIQGFHNFHDDMDVVQSIKCFTGQTNMYIFYSQ